MADFKEPKLKRRVNPETLLTRSIRQSLELCGWMVKKMHQGLGSDPGIPDLWILKDGESWWIEVKMPGRKLSEHQEQFGEDVFSHGGKFAVISSVEMLKTLGFLDNVIL